MKDKIKLGTRLWVTQRANYMYCIEVMVYTYHGDSVFAVDKTGENYHMTYNNDTLILGGRSSVSFEKNEDVDLVTPLL